jgi:hypothetical protein
MSCKLFSLKKNLGHSKHSVDEGNAFGFEVPYIVEKIWTRA